jgi:hypothetical protein
MYQTEYHEAPEWVGFPGAKGYSIWYSFPVHFEDTGKDPIFKMTAPPPHQPTKKRPLYLEYLTEDLVAMPLTLYFGRGSKRSGKLYQTEYPEAPE